MSRLSGAENRLQRIRGAQELAVTPACGQLDLLARDAAHRPNDSNDSWRRSRATLRSTLLGHVESVASSSEGRAAAIVNLETQWAH